MRRAVLLAAAALGLATAAPAYELLRTNNNPCARDQQNLFWRDAAVAVNATRLPERERALAEEARVRWNASATRFRFTQSGGAACARDGITSLESRTTPCGLDQFGAALAITRSVWNASGELVDSDVAFNADSYIAFDDAAFLHVAMHELGHVLGLAHSDACGASGAGTLMRAVLGSRPLEAPQADDVSGAEAIYPGGGGGGGGAVPEGANSCAVVAPRDRGALALLWLGAAALWWRARARRRD